MKQYGKLSASIFYVFLSVAISGCASLTREGCQNADWYAIGFSDGVRGYALDRQDKHRKSCSQYNIKFDLDRYLQGRSKGLKQYCVPENAYTRGMTGYVYVGTCPVSLSPDFYPAYRDGYHVYLLKAEIARKEARYKELDNKIHHLKNTRKRLHHLLEKSKKSASDRHLMKKEIRLLRHEIRQYESRLRKLGRQIEGLLLKAEHFQSDTQNMWLGR